MIMKELDTTLTLQGVQAQTFREMEDFAEHVETRPLDKLLGDLNGLVRLPDTKFELARLVLRRRLRELAEVEREQLRLFAEEVAAMADAEAAERIRSVFVQRAKA
ncbi:MAG TPA: hypothetical protein VG323_19985 [Thermoanaerobaculia bacterium]|nr:hypothetical protein [Thermoanaerobaculia bacterium]